MPRDDRRTFFQIITDAIADFEEHGFDDAERLAYWQDLIRAKLREAMPSVGRSVEAMNAKMRSDYERIVKRLDVGKREPTISAYTVEKLKPKMRAELDRRILASAELIKLNRARSIETTLQRFSGWATSIPAGGTEVNNRKGTKAEIRKPLAALPFEERRVAIDQGHKLVSSITEIIAEGSNAIAAEWHSNFRQNGYNYRVDHKERDSKIYIIRGSWADKAGLLKSIDGYTDELTKPGEEVFCRCQYRYIFALRNLPPEMLTEKGMAELAQAKKIAREILGR